MARRGTNLMDDIANYDVEYQNQQEPLLNEEEVPETPREIGSTSASTSGKKTRRRSEIWKFFDVKAKKMADGSVQERAFCKICNADFSCNPSQGTNHLNRHYRTCRSRVEKQTTDRTIQTQLQFSSQGSDNQLTPWHYDPNKARELHARFVAVKDLPIDFADDIYFQEYISQAYCPQFKKVSRNTTRKDIIE
jgi:hypothetical protein